MIHGEINTGLSRGERKREIVDILSGVVLTAAAAILVVVFQKQVLIAFPVWLKMLARFILAWVVALPCILILVFRRDRLQTLKIEARGLILQILPGLGFGVLLLAAHCLIMKYSGIFTVAKPAEQPLYARIYSVFYFFLAIAPTEEFIFRCFFYEKAKRAFTSDAAAVIISSVLFGLFHFVDGSWRLFFVLLIMPLGAIMALLRLKLKPFTLVSLVMLHGVFDTLGPLFSRLLF